MRIVRIFGAPVARSFSLLARSAASARSASGVAPRGRVPLIGRDSTQPSRLIRSYRSGDALSTFTVPKCSSAPNGAGLSRRNER